MNHCEVTHDKYGAVLRIINSTDSTAVQYGDCVLGHFFIIAMTGKGKE